MQWGVIVGFEAVAEAEAAEDAVEAAAEEAAAAQAEAQHSDPREFLRSRFKKMLPRKEDWCCRPRVFFFSALKDWGKQDKIEFIQFDN